MAGEDAMAEPRPPPTGEPISRPITAESLNVEDRDLLNSNQVQHKVYEHPPAKLLERPDFPCVDSILTEFQFGAPRLTQDRQSACIQQAPSKSHQSSVEGTSRMPPSQPIQASASKSNLENTHPSTRMRKAHKPRRPGTGVNKQTAHTPKQILPVPDRHHFTSAGGIVDFTSTNLKPTTPTTVPGPSNVGETTLVSEHEIMSTAQPLRAVPVDHGEGAPSAQSITMLSTSLAQFQDGLPGDSLEDNYEGLRDPIEYMQVWMKRERQAAEERLSQVQAQGRQVERELAAARNDLRSRQVDHSGLFQRLSDSAKELALLKEQHAATAKALEDAQADFTSKEYNLSSKLKHTLAAKARLEGSFEDLSSRNAQVQHSLSELLSQRDEEVASQKARACHIRAVEALAIVYKHETNAFISAKDQVRLHAVMEGITSQLHGLEATLQSNVSHSLAAHFPSDCLITKTDFDLLRQLTEQIKQQTFGLPNPELAVLPELAKIKEMIEDLAQRPVEVPAAPSMDISEVLEALRSETSGHFDTLVSHFKENTNTMAELATLQSTCTSIRKDLNDRIQEVRLVESELAPSEDSNSSLRAETESLRMTNASLDAHKSRLESQVHEQKLDIGRLQNALMACKSACGSAESRSSELKMQVDDLCKECDELKNSMTLRTQDEAGSVQDPDQVRRQAKEDLIDSLLQKESDCQRRLVEQHQDFFNVRHKLEQEIQRCQNEYMTSETRLKEQIEALESEASSTQVTIDDARKELAAAETRNSSLASERLKMIGEVSLLQQAIVTLKQQLADVTRTEDDARASLSTKMVDAETQLSDAQRASAADVSSSSPLSRITSTLRNAGGDTSIRDSTVTTLGRQGLPTMTGARAAIGHGTPRPNSKSKRSHAMEPSRADEYPIFDPEKESDDESVHSNAHSCSYPTAKDSQGSLSISKVGFTQPDALLRHGSSRFQSTGSPAKRMHGQMEASSGLAASPAMARTSEFTGPKSASPIRRQTRAAPHRNSNARNATPRPASRLTEVDAPSRPSKKSRGGGPSGSSSFRRTN